MTRPPVLSAFVLLCCCPALMPAKAQSASLQTILDSSNKQIDDAFIKGDPAPIRQLFSHDATIVNPVGARLGTEDLFSSIRTGTLKYKSIERSEATLVQYGHFAVLTYLTNEAGTVQRSRPVRQISLERSLDGTGRSMEDRGRAGHEGCV